MLIDELQKANIKALKEHDKSARAVLSVVISRYKLQGIEMKSAGKEINDQDMIKIITKVLKELDEEKEGYQKVNNVEEVESVNKQQEIIKKYLPKMLSEDEIRNEINKLEDKSMPSIMKYFKANFDGKVDMGLVNRIAKSL
ncbi:MAG TPA: hypothetical protein DDW20_01030 [Firmicutes bacterium]|nr:hypothetical protein [Bacillota bacterium]